MRNFKFMFLTILLMLIVQPILSQGFDVDKDIDKIEMVVDVGIDNQTTDIWIDNQTVDVSTDNQFINSIRILVNDVGLDNKELIYRIVLYKPNLINKNKYKNIQRFYQNS